MASHPVGTIPSIATQGDPHYMGPKYPTPAPVPAPPPAPLPVVPVQHPWAPPRVPPLPPSMKVQPVEAAPSSPADVPAASRTLQDWVQDFAAGAAMFGLLMGAFESHGSPWQIVVWTLGFAALGAWAGVLRWGMERFITAVSDVLDAVLDACARPLGMFAIGLAAAAVVIGHFLR